MRYKIIYCSRNVKRLTFEMFVLAFYCSEPRVKHVLFLNKVNTDQMSNNIDMIMDVKL